MSVSSDETNKITNKFRKQVVVKLMKHIYSMTSLRRCLYSRSTKGRSLQCECVERYEYWSRCVVGIGLEIWKDTKVQDLTF